MSADYIAAGASISHDQMNAIWSEVDRKMTLLLSGKSWFCASHVNADLMGQFFFFKSAVAPEIYKPIDGTTYDHSTYDNYAAALVVNSFDSSNHTALVDQSAGTFAGSVSTLDGSLQAHYRDTSEGRFYFWPDSGAFIRDNNGRPNRPERSYKLAVAEIVIEGRNALDLPTAWDKFNCFRLHNLSPYVCTVTFGTAYEIEVPAYGCRSVRREPDGTGYASLYNYFWDFRENDLRAITCQNPDPILTTMRANNVANPSMLFLLLETFCLGKVRWIPDFTITPPSTAGAAFGDASNPLTMLGDLITHPGTVTFADIMGGVVTFTDYQFATWQNLATELTALGLTVVQVGQSYTVQQLTGGKTTDAIEQTSNLFKSGTDLRAALNLNTVRTLDTNALDGDGTTELGTTEETTRDVTASTSFAVFSTSFPSGNNPTTETVSAVNPVVDSVDNSDAFGPLNAVSDLTASAQDADAKTYEDRQLLFTPFGPALLFTETLPPVSGRGSGITDIIGTSGAVYGGTSSAFNGTISAAGVISFPTAQFFINHGFQFADTINGPSGNSCAFWMGADAIRYYGGNASRAFPTGITGGDVADNGEDFGLTKIKANPMAISLQQRCDDNLISSGRFNAFVNSDNLHLFRRNVSTYDTATPIPPVATPRKERDVMLTPRFWLAPDSPTAAASQTNLRELYQDCLMPLDAEHFNTFAWMINIVTRCRPLTIADVPFLVNGSSVSLTPEQPLGTVKPVDCYALSATTLQAESVYSALNVPIKTENDFPPSWRNRTGNTRRETRMAFDVVLDQPQSAPFNGSSPAPYNASPFIGNYPRDTKWNGVSTFTGSQDIGSTALTSTSPDASVVAGAHWVTDDDVCAMAESLGFKFFHIALRNPLAVKRISHAPGGAIIPSPLVGWNSHPVLHGSGNQVLVPMVNYYSTPRNYTEFSYVVTVESARFVCALNQDDVEFTSDDLDTLWFHGEPPPKFTKFIPFQEEAYDALQPPPTLTVYGFYIGGTRTGFFGRDTIETLSGEDRYNYNGPAFEQFAVISTEVPSGPVPNSNQQFTPISDILSGYRFEQNTLLIHKFSTGFLPACGALFLQREFIGPNYDVARSTPLEYAGFTQDHYATISPLMSQTTGLTTWNALQSNPITGDEKLFGNGEEIPVTAGAAYFQPMESGQTFITANATGPAQWLQYLNAEPLIACT